MCTVPAALICCAEVEEPIEAEVRRPYLAFMHRHRSQFIRATPSLEGERPVKSLFQTWPNLYP